MNLPTAVKAATVALSFGGAGAIVLTGLSLPDVGNKTLSRDILLQNNRKALPRGHSMWKFALHRYKKYEKDDRWKVSQPLDTQGDLESWCEKALDSENSESLYSKVEKFCTDPSTKEELKEFTDWVVDGK